MEVDFKLDQAFIINDMYASISIQCVDMGRSGESMFVVRMRPDTAWFYLQIGAKAGIPVEKWGLLMKGVEFVFRDGIYFFNSLSDANLLAKYLIAMTSGEDKHKPFANQIKDNYERSVLGIENTSIK
jgi:hypothetical protein